MGTDCECLPDYPPTSCPAGTYSEATCDYGWTCVTGSPSPAPAPAYCAAGTWNTNAPLDGSGNPISPYYIGVRVHVSPKSITPLAAFWTGLHNVVIDKEFLVQVGATKVVPTQTAYFSFSGCGIQSGSNKYSCFGNQALPVTMPDTNYTLVCGASVTCGGYSPNLQVSIDQTTTTNFNYTLVEIMSNDCHATPYYPTISCALTHN